jgi:hypothetical protein
MIAPEAGLSVSRQCAGSTGALQPRDDPGLLRWVFRLWSGDRVRNADTVADLAGAAGGWSFRLRHVAPPPDLTIARHSPISI